MVAARGAGPPTRRSGGARSPVRHSASSVRSSGFAARPAGPVRDAGLTAHGAGLPTRRPAGSIRGAVGRLPARTRLVRTARIRASAWEIMTSPAGTDPRERRPDSTQYRPGRRAPRRDRTAVTPPGLTGGPQGRGNGPEGERVGQLDRSPDPGRQCPCGCPRPVVLAADLGDPSGCNRVSPHHYDTRGPSTSTVRRDSHPKRGGPCSGGQMSRAARQGWPHPRRPTPGRVEPASGRVRAREPPSDAGAHPLRSAFGAGERAPSRRGAPPGYPRRR